MMELSNLRRVRDLMMLIDLALLLEAISLREEASIFGA
jgi:hypothetical protein